MKCFYTTDWLEVYCMWPITERDHLMGNIVSSETYMIGKDFMFKKRDYGTRVYSCIADVTYKGQEFMTITYQPLSKIINESACHVKVTNYWLYTDKWLDILKLAFGEFRIKPIQVSRVDISCDWQYSRSGVSASVLMSKLVKGDYRKIHQPRWTLHAIDTEKELWYNGMSFGSKKSSCFTRFYNKSLELKEVKDKIYIRECWEQADLDLDKDVYRVEFQLKADGRKSIDKSTGAIIDISVDELIDRQRVQELFLYYAAYYFDIRRNDNERKDRSTQVDIFAQSDMDYKAWQNPRNVISTRTDKMVLNYIVRKLQEAEHQDTPWGIEEAKATRNFFAKLYIDKTFQKYAYEYERQKSAIRVLARNNSDGENPTDDNQRQK